MLLCPALGLMLGGADSVPFVLLLPGALLHHLPGAHPRRVAGGGLVVVNEAVLSENRCELIYLCIKKI